MNEADNIAPLVKRLTSALNGIDAAILFVDDSSDDTPAIIEQAIAQIALSVSCIHRLPDERDGLSGAVVRGIGAAQSAWVCVMDGDLQHPPEIVPLLLERAVLSSAEIVVASRQANRLGPLGLSRARSLTSNVLTLFARALFPRSLKDVSDPLTGFFLFKRDAVNISRLRPDGFKILLEILVRHPDLRSSEIFFDFALRNAGDSKADLREGMRFFRHVMRLRVTAHRRPFRRYLSIVGSALALSVGSVGWLTGKQKWSPTAAAFVATLLGDGWRWFGRRQFILPKRERAYHLGNRYWLASLTFATAVVLPVFSLLRRFSKLPITLTYSLTLAIAGFTRYLFSDRWVWTRGLVGAQPTSTAYNIHDQLLIHSPVPIPDLGWFQSSLSERVPDIVVRVDRHGTPRQFENAVSFDDHLGRFGFAFTILLNQEQVEVVISPLIAAAPHVLYVNILEPLMRYLLLKRGQLLLQAGAIIEKGGCCLISTMGRYPTAEATFAMLDVNKAAQYVGHDHVLLTETGEAFCFPLAMTTTKLLDMNQARQLGAWLRQIDQFPAATINAWVQRLFPPVQQPIVQRLERERIVERAQVTGVELVNGKGINSADKLATIILQNAQDPLGFPLFKMLADYELRRGQFDLFNLEQERLLTIIRKLP